MTLRSIPISETKASTLEAWSLHEVKLPAFNEPTRHLVGYAVEAAEGRVSSPVIELDAATRRARTASGRVYHLVGEPGTDPDGAYVWKAWRRIHEAEVLGDLTLTINAAMRTKQP